MRVPLAEALLTVPVLSGPPEGSEERLKDRFLEPQDGRERWPCEKRGATKGEEAMREGRMERVEWAQLALDRVVRGDRVTEDQRIEAAKAVVIGAGLVEVARALERQTKTLAAMLDRQGEGRDREGDAE